MRLTCPNCDAQYEVPDDVIPQEGRDVQCSNCGNTWFQPHSDHVEDAVADLSEPEPDEEWTPEVSEDEPLKDTSDQTDDHEETAPEPEADRPTRVSANTPDEVLAAAVKAALMRARPQATEDDADAADAEQPPEAHDPEEEGESFEEALDATLTQLEDDEEAFSFGESSEDEVYFEPGDAEPEEIAEPEEEPKRRTIDPTVANILKEEAALEAERRAESSSLESQPDLGLAVEQDDAAKRARQARERMARMRGLSPDDIDKPVEPVPENSRRDLLPDIEEINSTLRSADDRTPDEQPDGRPTANQRRAGGSRIGFALAFLLIGLLAFVYNRPETVTANVPGSEPYVAAFGNFVDNARIWLDSQLTKLMLWLDSLSSS